MKYSIPEMEKILEGTRICIDKNGKLFLNCSEYWDSEIHEIDGVCECGTPTVNGFAAVGCNYSPKSCDICGFSDCDGSC